MASLPRPAPSLTRLAPPLGSRFAGCRIVPPLGRVCLTLPPRAFNVSGALPATWMLMAPHGNDFHAGFAEWGGFEPPGGLRPCCFRDSRIRPLCHYSTDPHEGTNRSTYSCGSRAPGGIRTHDQKVRTLLLWSTELREQGGCLLRFKKSDNPFPKE